VQSAATHCSALKRTAAHWSALQRTAAHCSALQRTAIHCYTLQFTLGWPRVRLFAPLSLSVAISQSLYVFVSLVLFPCSSLPLFLSPRSCSVSLYYSVTHKRKHTHEHENNDDNTTHCDIAECSTTYLHSATHVQAKFSTTPVGVQHTAVKCGITQCFHWLVISGIFLYERIALELHHAKKSPSREGDSCDQNVI